MFQNIGLFASATLTLMWFERSVRQLHVDRIDDLAERPKKSPVVNEKVCGQSATLTLTWLERPVRQLLHHVHRIDDLAERPKKSPEVNQHSLRSIKLLTAAETFMMRSVLPTPHARLCIRIRTHSLICIRNA